MTFTMQRIGNSNETPALIFAGMRDGEEFMRGGLMWNLGRCWVWFNGADKPVGWVGARALIKAADVMFKKAVALGETEVFTYRDDHLTSERLLSMCGMEFVDVELVEYEGGRFEEKELWRWQN